VLFRSKALRCQQAEHTFADTPCGIMDQYISAMGKENNLLLIDCRTQEYKLVELGGQPDDPHRPVVLVTNSNVKHSLSGSEYPDRVKQCHAAVEIIASANPDENVKALRDVNVEMLNGSKQDMPEVVFRRARHCVGEDRRTIATIESLKIRDYESVGQYMLQSHISLKEDFEVSCEELDLLVTLAMEVEGVYGSRMTGGGFGGCTVTLVKKSAVPALRAHLKAAYKEKTGKECDCYEAVPAAGAGVIPLARSESPANSFASWLLPVAVGALVISVAFHFARKR